jgi:hypothetical protein
MVSVVSPHLLAVGGAWDDGPGAGAWIADRLGPFGPSVGHAVPLNYPAYAIVPIPLAVDDDDLHQQRVPVVMEALLAVIEPFTRRQVVHCGIWDGWSWWYDTGTDPRTASAGRLSVMWADGEEPPSREEIERERAAVSEILAATLVECPDTEPLDLPHRRYYLWTGPLRSAMAFRHQPHDPPSLIWPADRSWFVGLPIYTNEIAVAGSTRLIDAVIAHPRLGARRATPDDVLAGED